MATFTGLNGVTSAGTAGYNPQPAKVPTENSFQKGMNDQDEIYRKEDEQNRQRTDKVMEAIFTNPDKADLISQQFGVPITPEVRELLKNPQVAQATMNGAKLAKELGIENPEAQKLFVSKYVQSGGNVIESYNAMGDMRTSKWTAPNVTGLPKGMMWDESTGQPTAIPNVTKNDYYKDDLAAAGGVPKTAGLPDGMMWDANGNAVQIPGVERTDYGKIIKPWENPKLPVDLQVEGYALANSPFPDADAIAAWQQRAQEALKAASPATPPPAPSGIPGAALPETGNPFADDWDRVEAQQTAAMNGGTQPGGLPPIPELTQVPPMPTTPPNPVASPSYTAAKIGTPIDAPTPRTYKSLWR